MNALEALPQVLVLVSGIGLLILSTLTAGHWRTKGFTAAILEASDIAQASNPAKFVEAFLNEAAAAALRALRA